jgi:ABC-type multidrug transport system ATPase subunit
MIRLKDVSFSYRAGETVIAEVNLQIQAGLTLLLGPNGCGKSTLLKLAAGVERPDTGTAEIDGHDLWKDEAAARRPLAYVPEQPDLTPYATIQDVMRLVCRLRSESLESGREALERVGLAASARRSVRELSMGQRRRATLAAAWIGSPRVVLMDEPLEAMDRLIRQDILAWVDTLLARGATVAVATHELEPFLAAATRAVTVRAGRCTLHEPLPAQADRAAFLDRLSKSR